MHQSYTLDEGAVILVLWSGRHFNISDPNGSLWDVHRCRNPECRRSSFQVASRDGDRVCNYCGVVQNARSLESMEEEHRTFKDDRPD